MYVKELYPQLFTKMWPDPDLFLSSVLQEDNPMWGPGGAGREFSKEILMKDNRWEWLGARVDDFACIIEVNMRKKLHKWIWRAQLGEGALAKRLCNTETVVKWLMDRYVAELKNLFDSRYRIYIELSEVQLTSFEESHTSAGTEVWQNRDPWEESTCDYSVSGGTYYV